MDDNVKYVLKEGPGAKNNPTLIKIQPIVKENENENQQYQNGTDADESETNSSAT